MNLAGERLPYYSIIVPVHNEAGMVARCLESLTQQDYPADHYEVIVVDDGSTDHTAEVVGRFPVRLIRLESNEGRIVARNTGARAATHDKLLLTDSRVTFPLDGLRRLAQIEHLPQIFFVFHTHEEGRGWFNRLLMLIRWRWYRPTIPFTPEEAAGHEPFFITPENYHRAFKGTTAIACQRDLWLECQPEETHSKHLHEEGLILPRIIERVPILKRYDIAVTYYQRERLSVVVPHLFWRGPRWASYYLKPGGMFRRWWIALWGILVLVLTGLIVLAVVIGPLRVLLGSAGLGLLLLLIAGIALARRPADVFLVMALLPILVGSFGAGVLWGVFVLRQASSAHNNMAQKTDP